jgi:hypothetical protein
MRKTLSFMCPLRVARWYYTFRPNIANWVNFRGSGNGRCWYILCIGIWSILRRFGLFYGLLIYLIVIWYVLWPAALPCCYLLYFSTFWYIVPRKIWQPWPRLKIGSSWTATQRRSGKLVSRRKNFNALEPWWFWAMLPNRVARFFLVLLTKTGKNITNNHKIYQMATKYNNWL